MSFNISFLKHNRGPFSIVFALALTSTACVVELGEGGTIDDDGPGDFVSAIDDSNSGGQDGSSEPAVGGAGGDDGAAGEGGSAGESAEELVCVAPEGTGSSADICDGLPLANVSCDGSPYGFRACQRAFGVFNEGSAEDFASCLATVPQEEACSVDPVSTCAAAMYEQACESVDIELACTDFRDTCGEIGESFDDDKCVYELNPFSEQGMNELIDCMNDGVDLTCQDRYDSCLDEVLALD